MLFRSIRVLLKLRIHFEHHVILVELREHGGDLALSERVVQVLSIACGSNSQPRRGVAIDHQVRFKPPVLLIAGHIAQSEASVAASPPVAATTSPVPARLRLPSNTDTACG